MCLLLSLGAPAQVEAKPPNFQDVRAARNFGMGGAYRALGYGAEAINGNPAALSLFKRYTLELSGAYDIQNQSPIGSTSR